MTGCPTPASAGPGTPAAGTTRPATSTAAATPTAPARPAPTRTRLRPDPDINGQNAGYPYCPDKTFQQHHQPLRLLRALRAGHPRPRAAHLKDEKDFLAQAEAGTLPKVSFIKPLGERERAPRLRQRAQRQRPPGRPDQGDPQRARGQEHPDRRDVRRVRRPVGPHVASRQGRAGAHDQFGPGTRIPAPDRVARSDALQRRPHGLRHDVDHGDDRDGLRPRAGGPPGRRDPAGQQGRPLTHMPSGWGAGKRSASDPCVGRRRTQCAPDRCVAAAGRAVGGVPGWGP